jgi:glycogen phosphorylase
VYLYQQIKLDPELEIVPRTFIFGDVDRVFTTPAMTIDDDSETPVSSISAEIKLIITDLTAVLATDPDVRGRLQIVYVPQSAGLTTQMYRAADLTEQIATAEMTDIDLSQLKFAINGVLSISSMSKANHLLQQDIGAENCFSFGLAIPEISLFKTYGYDPYNYYKYYPEIRQMIDALLSGRFTTTDTNSCQVLVDELLGTDEHMVLAEYIFYLACQSHVSQTYRQQSVWTRMSILNVAGVG